MLTRCSKRSIRRLVQLVTCLEEPSYIFHQILTFHPPVTNTASAKGQLDALLCNLHHRFNMASVHVRHLHKAGGIHYHAMFFFWEKTPFAPSRMKSEFGTAVFNAWNKVQNGRLVRAANRNAKHPTACDLLKYLLRRVRVAAGPTKSKRWWTYRNAGLLKSKAVRLSRAELRAAFNYVMPCRPYKIRDGNSRIAPIGKKEVLLAESLEACTRIEAQELESRTLEMAPSPFGEAPQVAEDPFAVGAW